MLKNQWYLQLLCFFFFISLRAQTQEIKTTSVKIFINKAGTFSFNNTGPDYFPSLQNLEMPDPTSEKAKLIALKEEINLKYPLKSNLNSQKRSSDTVPAPSVGLSYLNHPYYDAYPLDNHLAISNHGVFISVINSIFYAYNINTDSVEVFKSLESIASPLGIVGSKFDPKIIYDPIKDRFILVFLNGATANSSEIIVGFSSTSNPSDNWNMYRIEGAPFNDTTWSDYPAISLTKDELFITMNLVKEGVSWQNGFSQSIIWQIEKEKGYIGETILPANLWSGINYNQKYIRNLNPIIGGSEPHGPNAFFLSNRNFALQNDSIFLVEITNSLHNNPTLNVSVLKSNINYGMPPDGRQGTGGPKLATNDGRILAGFIENGTIQFVSNTIDTSSGLAGIFHGVINNTYNSPFITANIITDGVCDFGYPNISFSGKGACNKESIISFEHTSPSSFAGLSAVYFSNNNSDYSKIIKVKEGLNVITKPWWLTINRWGDYSGSQRKYNEPGKVWISGTFADLAKKRATWVAELTHSNEITITQVEINDVSIFDGDDGSIKVIPIGGTSPYNFEWDDLNRQKSQTAVGLKAGIYSVSITDACGNFSLKSFNISQPNSVPIYPNPTSDIINVSFNLNEKATILASVYDINGNLVAKLMEENAKRGLNVFSFSTNPLSNGIYFLKITSGEKLILKKKIVKID